MPRQYHACHLNEIRPPVEREEGSYEWKPVRQHFDVRAFGVNAFVAPDAGDEVIEDHDEFSGGAAGHEELYFVARGRAAFTVDGEALDAPQGTFVFVPDPASRRTARAVEADTAVVVIGGKQGQPYEVSKWEAKYFRTPSKA